MLRKPRGLVIRGDKPARSAADKLAARKRNRAVFKSLLVGGLAVDSILGALLLYLVFLHMPYFNLQQVDVTGNQRLSKEEVIEASELEAGMNLLAVNLASIAGRLKRHPWIRSASVYRRLPGRMIIEIHERTPRAILAAGKLYYVDGQADFFTRVLPGDPVNYPLFAGVNEDELKSEQVEVREMIRTGLALLDIVERTEEGLAPSAVSEIWIDLDRGLTLRTVSGRTVVLGRSDYEMKLKRYGKLKSFLSSRGEWNNARIIDLDFEDRALVRSGAARVRG